MMRRILFIRPIWACNATFVLRDQDILAKHYHLTEMAYQEGDKLFLLRLIKHLSCNDLCFVWFGGLHAFWALVAARMLGKKIIIVAGGYDAIYLPEIGYGIRAENNAWRRTYYSFRHADRVLAVSNFVIDSLKNECGVRGDNIELVYNGIDVEQFQSDRVKDEIVLTVGHVNRINIIKKGFKTFIEAARHLQNINFVLIGGGADGAYDRLRSDAPSNVKFTGSIDIQEVKKYMAKAKVYAQLSANESFGVALAEAMLCESVPVATNRGSLPEVAGPDAYYVDYGDVEGTVKQIKQALLANSGFMYRRRVSKLFSMENRKEKICKMIDGLLAN